MKVDPNLSICWEAQRSVNQRLCQTLTSLNQALEVIDERSLAVGGVTSGSDLLQIYRQANPQLFGDDERAAHVAQLLFCEPFSLGLEFIEGVQIGLVGKYKTLSPA